jgi:hypothetical protein
MPRARIILLASSLAANAALGLVLWKWPVAVPKIPRGVDSSAPKKSAPKNSAVIAHDEIWSHLASDPSDVGDANFVTQLRVEGFPERVIRVLLDYRLNERFLPEVRELHALHKRNPYWRNDDASRWNLTPDAYARVREIEQQVAEQKRLLLGPAASQFQPGDYGEHDLRRYGNLLPEKIAALKAIQKDYRELEDRIQESTRGVTLPEDREKLAFLEKQKQDDIARLITPDELDQYERRSSPAGHFARTQLQFLDATEDEFLALYRLRQNFDQRFGVTHLSREQSEQRRTAESEFEKDVAAVLGAERFAEYQLTNDKNYPETRTFVTESGLPPSTAVQLVAIQRESLKQADSIKADTSLSSQDKNQQLSTLQRTVREKASALLGPDRASSLDQYNAGRWLSSIAPTPEKQSSSAP